MAINYASKYSEKVDDAFEKKAYSEIGINNDYDFTGVKTVNVYSYKTVELTDYTKEGANRYGTIAELDDEVQAMTLSQDKAFTFSIDRANRDDRMMTAEAGKRLAVEINQVIIPTIDKYRFSQMSKGAKNTLELEAEPTRDNAYETLLKVNALLDEESVPDVGRILYVTPAFYNLIKLDSSFVDANLNTTDISATGYVGDIDGMTVVKVPSTYLPEKVQFIITHPSATTSPIKLQTYNVHENPVGIDGWVVEGRVYYDAFVLNNKKGAIGVCKTSTP